jgi:alkylation response protein AidB-like acyl-CoA dehydrogenase
MSLWLSDDMVVGEAGSAANQVERQLQIACVLQCTEVGGVINCAFDTTLGYLLDRYSFGRPLASYQAIKHRMADAKMWVESCRATGNAAARAVQRDEPNSSDLVSVAKSFIGDHSLQVLQECVQLHGGIALTWDHDLHLYLRRATQSRGLFGTPSQHRERLAISAGLGIQA